MLITLLLLFLDFKILLFTLLNIPFDFTLLIDLSNNILLKASPSSTINAFLITFSSVMKLPNILILSTKDFSSWFKKN